MKIGNIELSIEELNQAKPEIVSAMVKAVNKKTTSKATKKKIVNGHCPIDAKVELVELENGNYQFKADGFRTNARKEGYSLLDIETAQQMIEAKQFATAKDGSISVSPETKLPYAKNGINENLVIFAKKLKLIE